MTSRATHVVVVLVVVAACYGAFLTALFRHVTARTPAGIVRRLCRTGRPVTLTVNVVNTQAWDPSKPLGQGGFYAHGTATYTLDDPQTIRVRFLPRSGGMAIERSARIPTPLLPDTSGMRRRRRLARIVITLYLLIGVSTFAVTAAVTGGTASLRIRVAALAALVAVAVAWLVTHFMLTQRASTRARSTQRGGARTTPPPHHLMAWLVSYLTAAAALGVAWHLGNLDQPHPMSWASSFLSSSIFVLVSVAAASASLHHHTYLHHVADKPPGAHKP